MKQIAAALLCLIVGVSFAQPKSELENVKQRALETVEVVKRLSFSPIVSHWPKGNKCNVSAQNLYAGEPFLVRSFIRPTDKDLARLRRRVEAARREDPYLLGDARGEVEAALLNDRYEVPI